MRSLDLLGIAARAESLRWRREASGAARRMAWRMAAAGFVLAAAILLHVAGWMALAQAYGPVMASLGLAGIDLLLAAIMLLAGRRRADVVALEARHVRELALARVSKAGMVGEGLGLLGWRGPAMALGGMLIEQAIKAARRP